MVKILECWFNAAPLRDFNGGADLHSCCVHFYRQASATVLAQQGGAVKFCARIYNATPPEIAAMQRFNFQKAVEFIVVNKSNFLHAIPILCLKAVRSSGGQ
jgi:hypothetical protein